MLPDWGPGSWSKRRGALVLALLAFGVYAASLYVGPLIVGRPAQSDQIHYVHLADALLHGRLDVDAGLSTQLVELVLRGGRYYVAYPPMPAIILMPFVAVFGVGFPSALLSIALAAASVGLVWVLVQRLGYDGWICCATALLFGFGTALWYTALKGSSWNLALVTASFFLLLALVESTGRRRSLLIGLALGAAGLARLPVFLALPFFVAWLAGDRKKGWSSIGALVLGAGLAVGVNMAYNWARYGSVLDLSYVLIPGVLEEPWYSKGIVHFSYLPRNLYRLIFLPPALSERFPYIVPSTYGTSLLFTTPAFLLCFFAPKGRRNGLFAVGALLVALPSLFHGGGGWTQYGYRYSLDYTPFLLVLAAAGMSRLSGLRTRGRVPLAPQVLAVVGLSVALSVWGLAFARPIPPGDFFPFAEEIEAILH